MIMHVLIWVTILGLSQPLGALLNDDREAMELAQAHDYDQAAGIFEAILKQSLPAWQRAVALYNLGTVRLAQKQSLEALKTYSLIPFQSVSTPQLIRFVYLNKGIAYLNAANDASNLKNGYDLIDQIDEYQESLNQFHEVHQLDCQLRTLEDEDLVNCQSAPDVEFLIARAIVGKNEAQKQLISAQIQNSGIVIDILTASIKTLMGIVKKQSSDKYQEYLGYQANRMLPLWEQLKSSDKPFNAFQKGVNSLKKGEFDQSLIFLKESLAQLAEFEKSDAHQWEYVLFNYQRIWINSDYTLENIQDLAEMQSHLIADENSQPKLLKANEYLQLTMQNIEKDQRDKAEYYFIGAYDLMQDFHKNRGTDPKKILIEAWLHAKLALRAFTLQDETDSDIAKHAQQHVLQIAKLFLPAVLALENEQYLKPNVNGIHCQKKPWDQVIPLFDRGYQEALKAKKTLAIQEMQQTIHYWKDALKLMDQTPSPEASPTSSQTVNKAQAINETLRLIQEMQAEDQPGPQASSAELDSW